jgi:hypothetical protein
MTGIQQIIIGVMIGGATALVSQWLSGWWGVKHLKTNIYLSNKADAYAALFAAIHNLLPSPHNELKYAAYRSAFERAKMFASEDVRRILEGDKNPQPDTLSHAIEILRHSDEENRTVSIRVNELYYAMSRLSDAGRRDIQSLSV